MKFKLDVQNRKLAWPTQKRFDKESWKEAVNKYCEDDEDRAVAEAGLWIFDALDQIRSEMDSSPIWGLSADARAKYLFGLCNRDLTVANNMASFLPSDGMGRNIVTVMEERIYESSQHKWWGSRKISNLLETGIDATNRCIDVDLRTPGTTSRSSQEQLGDAIKALNLAALYLATEDCFYEALWSDWRLSKVEEEWRFVPHDVDSDKKWEASCRRLSDIQSQTMSYLQFAWQVNSQLREKWTIQTGGIATFRLERHDNVITVKFTDKIESSRLPFSFILGAAAREFYYEPLLREPLPLLNSCCLLDALNVFSLLGEISRQIMEDISDESPIHSLEETVKFCPILLERPIVSALSEATGLKKKDVVKILRSLIWKQKKSLWFHPLVMLETPQGPGYIFAALPLDAPNIFRIIDYWLETYGLSMEQRGRLFERQIEEDVELHTRIGGVEQSVRVAKIGEILSADRSSKEEIDLLILINDLVVVVEAKCQTIPITSIDRYNYLQTLKGGAAQAVRKAMWIKSNIEVAAKAMKINPEKLSGDVQPIVVSNHSVGAGFIFDGVPVMDLRLLDNYFSQPYLKETRFTSKELREIRKSPRFYNGPREMADNFVKYANDPDFLKVCLGFLKPSWTPLPIRTDQTVVRLQYLMDTEAVSASVD